MARPKRKVNPILPVAAPAEPVQRIYQVGGYVRLSMEDSGKPGTDTMETQRELIENYIESQPDMRLLISIVTTDGREQILTARNLSA